MIELLMVYCISGEPCTTETLAIFPQEDIGAAICEIARPAIASAIREKVSERASVTFSCECSAMPPAPGYSPRMRDNRITMAEPGNVSPVDVAREIIERLSK